MSFFSSATLFLLCRQQKVKQILYFDKMNTNYKYDICKFLYKLSYIIIIFFSLCDTFCCVENKIKTNLIVDKTNKINSLQ